MRPPDIRSPRADDRSAWEALWSGYQTFYAVEIPTATTDETWRRLLDPAEPVWAALAWQDDAAVGLAQWVFHRSTWSASDFCYLNDLFVTPATRGGGVGRKLIGHVQDEARRAGCGRLYWLTHESNAQAMTLYDAVASKSGFVQYRMPV